MHATNKPKIVFWNAQGITTKTKQLQLEYFATKEEIDVFLLAETFLKPQHTFILNNYIIYRNDRINQVHGGVAIAIRKSLPHKYRAPFNTKSIENIAVELMIENELTCITAAYCPKQTTHFRNDILF